jgi:hypothetical protein
MIDKRTRQRSQISRSAWRLSAAAAIVALLLIGTNVDLIRGESLPKWDGLSYFAPAQVMVADHARHGRLVSWNPLMNCGSPDGSDPQFGANSPLTVVVGLVTGPSAGSFIMLWLLAWGLGGLGVYLWASDRGCSWDSAITGAIGFICCGFMVGHGQHTSFVISAAVVPWAVWRLDSAVAKRRAWPQIVASIEAGCFWGLGGLAGYPGLTISTGLFLPLWLFGQLFFRHEEDNPSRHKNQPKILTFCRVNIMMGLACAIVLAPAYLGYVKGVDGYSDRAGTLDRKRSVESNALAPGSLLTMASPHVAMVKNWNRSLWSYTDPSTVSSFVTPLLLCCFLAGIVAAIRFKRPWYLWCCGVGFLFLGFAFGRVLPLRGWLFDFVYVTRFFRHPGLFRFFFVLTVILLGTVVLDRLLRSRSSDSTLPWRRIGRVGLVFSVLGLSVILITAYWLSSSPDLDLQPGYVVSFLAFGIVLWGTTGAIFWAASRSAGQRGVSKRSDLALRTVVVLVSAATCAVSIRVSAPFMTTRHRAIVESWSQAENASADTAPFPSVSFDRVLDSPYWHAPNNLNFLARLPVMRSYNPLSEKFFIGLTQDPHLARIGLGEHRVWFSTNAITCARTPHAFKALVDRAAGGASMPMTLTPPGVDASSIPQCENEIRQAPGVVPAEFEVESYTWNTLALSVNSPSEGFLLLTDRWAPGWRAWVNGAEHEILRDFFGFRVVKIPQGRSRIDYSYSQFGRPWLIIASWGLMGLAILNRSLFRSFRRKPAVAQP